MREIDETVLLAQSDSFILNKFIKDNEHFIIKTIYEATGKYITKSDDKWSIGLSAFYEAIQSYSYEKGHFYSLASLIIKRRLIDNIKKQNKYVNEISTNIFDEETALSEDSDRYNINKAVIDKVSIVVDTSIKDEIEILTKSLNSYGFDFFDLVSTSPKALKTKVACAKAISFVIKNPIILIELRKTKLLPLKIIENNAKVPRKILERHRKYIIAGIEIMSGDYQYLAEYLQFVREEIKR